MAFWCYPTSRQEKPGTSVFIINFRVCHDTSLCSMCKICQFTRCYDDEAKKRRTMKNRTALQKRKYLKFHSAMNNIGVESTWKFNNKLPFHAVHRNRWRYRIIKSQAGITFEYRDSYVGALRQLNSGIGIVMAVASV